MKLIYLHEDFTAEIPNNWEAKIIQGLISLLDPVNGYGVMQFSFYIVRSALSLNLVDELEEYLEDKYEHVKANLTDDYAYVDIVSSTGIFWRYWLLRKKTNIVFVSYNCAKEDIGKENDIVDNIVRSIAIRK